MGKEPSKWGWLPAVVPGVARLMAEKRRTLGAEHVAECWKRGMAGEPGWFFAREGAVAIGTPWGDAEMANFAALQITATQALVVIREKERGEGHGA